MHWDSASESAWFQYALAGKNHSVWFGNAAAMIPKVQLATAAGIRGVVIWDLGNEDPALIGCINERDPAPRVWSSSTHRVLEHTPWRDQAELGGAVIPPRRACLK